MRVAKLRKNEIRICEAQFNCPACGLLTVHVAQAAQGINSGCVGKGGIGEGRRAGVWEVVRMYGLRVCESAGIVDQSSDRVCKVDE